VKVSHEGSSTATCMHTPCAVEGNRIGKGGGGDALREGQAAGYVVYEFSRVDYTVHRQVGE
jgi:hypothetical protein